MHVYIYFSYVRPSQLLLSLIYYPPCMISFCKTYLVSKSYWPLKHGQFVLSYVIFFLGSCSVLSCILIFSFVVHQICLCFPYIGLTRQLFSSIINVCLIMVLFPFKFAVWWDPQMGNKIAFGQSFYSNSCQARFVS